MICTHYFAINIETSKAIFAFTATAFTYQLLIFFRQINQLSFLQKTWISLLFVISLITFISFDFKQQFWFFVIGILPLFYHKIRSFGWLKLFFIGLTATCFPLILIDINIKNQSLYFIMFTFVLHWFWMLCFEIIDAKNGDKNTFVKFYKKQSIITFGWILFLTLFMIVLFIDGLVFLIPLLMISGIYFILSLKFSNPYITKIGLEILPFIFGIFLIK